MSSTESRGPAADARSPWSVKFRKERESQWVELEQMVEVALNRGVRSLPPDDLRRLPLLYRFALASLSVARRTAMDRHLVAYLESLAARAYLVVYGSRKPTRGAIRAFVLETFPSGVRKIRAEVGVSTLFFFLGVLVAWMLTAGDEVWYYAFVPAELAQGRTPDSSTEDLRQGLYAGGGGGLLTFASFLFTHNAKVGMLAFALGFAAGIPTLLLLFYNGLVLGAFLALYAEHGLLLPALGWLLPHGIPEIGAVLLCGAAGLHIGRRLLWPGRLAVRDAMVRAGRTAAAVAMGSVLLFAVAGVVEGVFRQAIGSDAARFAFAAFNLAWLLVWLAFAGRAQDGDEDGGPSPRPVHTPEEAAQ